MEGYGGSSSNEWIEVCSSNDRLGVLHGMTELGGTSSNATQGVVHRMTG
jgi:hypothetical protein